MHSSQQSMQSVFEGFFQRAVVSISYSAADRLAQHLMLNQYSIAFGMLILALTLASLLLLQPGKNECIQTTLTILVSKLITRKAFLPMEPQTSYLILPTVAFYVMFCATLCAAIAHAVKGLGPRFTTQWDSIVPYIVVFCTSAIVRTLQQKRQIHFLYFIVLCYPLCASTLEKFSSKYASLFTESIVSRGVVLIVENYVFGKIHKADIALSFFYMSIIVCTHYVLQPARISTFTNHLEVCLGVLLYSFSRHVLQTMQTYCNNEIGTIFAFTAALLIGMLYQRHIFSTSTIEFCINSLSILWSGMLNTWIFNFYHKWEPLFIYLMVFVLIQQLHDLVILHISPDVPRRTAQHIIQMQSNNNNNKEIMLIGCEMGYISSDF